MSFRICKNGTDQGKNQRSQLVQRNRIKQNSKRFRESPGSSSIGTRQFGDKSPSKNHLQYSNRIRRIGLQESRDNQNKERDNQINEIHTSEDYVFRRESEGYKEKRKKVKERAGKRTK